MPPYPKAKPVPTPSRAPDPAPPPPCQAAAPVPVNGVSAKSTPVKSPDYKKVRMGKAKPDGGVVRSLDHDFKGTVKAEQQPDVRVVGDMVGKQVS